MGGNDHCRVICRLHHQTIQQFLHGQFFTGNQIHARTAGIHTCHHFLRNRNDLIQVAHFHSHQAGHDFRQTGRIQPLVGIIGVDHGLRFCLKQQRCLSIDLKICKTHQADACIDGMAAVGHAGISRPDVGRLFRCSRLRRICLGSVEGFRFCRNRQDPYIQHHNERHHGAEYLIFFHNSTPISLCRTCPTG